MAVEGLAVSDAEVCGHCEEEFDYMLVVGSTNEYKWVCPKCGATNTIEDEESELEFYPTVAEAVAGGEDA